MRLEKVVGKLDQWAIRQAKEPVAEFLYKMRVRATPLNFAGLIGCAIAALLIPLGELTAAGLIFFFASGLDAFDGSLARRQGTADTFSLGAWLDAFLGTVAEMLVGLALVFHFTDPALIRLAGVSLASTFLVSHSKAVAGEYSISPDWSEARLVGRGVRITILSIGLVLAGSLSGHATSILEWTLVGLIVINIVTLAYRCAKIVRQARLNDRCRQATMQTSSVCDKPEPRN